MRAHGVYVIVYRTQASSGESWATQWSQTQQEATRLAGQLVAAGYTSPHVDRIELGTGKEAIVLSLNHAGVSRINWEGEPVALTAARG